MKKIKKTKKINRNNNNKEDNKPIIKFIIQNLAEYI